MRTIKFRGQTEEGVWLYGDLLQAKSGRCYIVISDVDGYWNYNLVVPETVGQFTGLTTRKGDDIYEGDVVQTVAHDGVRLSKFTIIWSKSRCRFMKEREDGNFYDLEATQTLLEVIGNIHQPEPNEAETYTNDGEGAESETELTRA